MSNTNHTYRNFPVAQFSISNTISALKRYGLRHSDCVYLSRYINKQIINRGKEGASTFLKQIGNQLINYIAKNGKKTQWIKTDSSGFPSALAPFKGCTKVQLLAIAKMARRIILDDVSKQQIQKVVSGIIGPKTYDNTLRLSQFIQLGSSSLGLYSKSSQPCDPSRVTRTVKRFVTTGDNHRLPNVVNHTTAPVRKSFEVLKSFKELQDLPYAYEAFHPISLESYNTILSDTLPDSGNNVGIICGQQEGGAKLRAFAAPHTIVQALMYPIHHWIAEYNKLIPNCCSYEQERGAIEAQRRLKLGQYVASVDLSTATCRFPLDVQLELLTSLGLEPVYIKALEKVSRSNWRVLAGMGSLNGSKLAWTVGQPLGLAPSMSMFTLTHICLIAGICRKLGVPSSEFYVLGDDVVIFNEEVCKLYIELMEMHGVSISWSKTHESNTFAEFAGYSITDSVLTRPGQMKDITHDNLLSTVHDFGAQESLSDHWNKLQRYYLWKLGRLETTDPKEQMKFLKANSLVQFSLLKFSPKFGVDWYTWVTESILKDYPACTFYSACRVSPMYMTQLFPIQNPFFQQLVDRFFMDSSPDEWYRPSFQVTVFAALTSALRNSVRGGYLSQSEAELLMERLDSFVTQDFVNVNINDNVSALASLDRELRRKMTPSCMESFISTRIKDNSDGTITITADLCVTSIAS